MKTLQFVLLFSTLPALAGAVVITLGPSTQTVTFTGTGANSAGAGTARITWGSCSFDGNDTTCIVSGPYTGLGTGGTYKFTLVYPGNGLSPLSSVATPAGTDLVSFRLAAGSYGFMIIPNTGDPLNFYDLRFNVAFSPGTSSCSGVATCGVGAVGLSTGGTIIGPLNGAFDLTPVISSPGGVITASAYGGSGAIAPGSWMEIYGLNLSTTLNRLWAGDDFNGVRAPTSLGGTSVTVGGRPAYVSYVNRGQVNVQVPSDVPAGPQPVVVTTAGGPSAATTVTVNAIEPGILAPPVFKLPAGQYAVALFPDGRTFVLPPGTVAGIPTARAKPGDTILLYGVGFGPVTPAVSAGVVVQQANSLPAFSASFAGVPATVAFAGLGQGFLGLYQFNIVVPNVPPGDAVPFTFSVAGTPGKQTLLLPIGN